jgi:hypothetical protein
MLLLATELHPYRCAHRFGQERRIGGNVVSAIAAIATCGFHPNHIYLGIVHATQYRKVSPQNMRVLRTGPNTQLHMGRLCIRTL